MLLRLVQCIFWITVDASAGNPAYEDSGKKLICSSGQRLMIFLSP